MADADALRQRKLPNDIPDEPIDTNDQIALIEQLERDALAHARFFKALFMGGALAFALFKLYSAMTQWRAPWTFVIHAAFQNTLSPEIVAFYELLSATSFALNAFYLLPAPIHPKIRGISSRRISIVVSLVFSLVLTLVWLPNLDLAHQLPNLIYYSIGNFLYTLLAAYVEYAWSGSAEEANGLRKYVYNFKSL